MRALVYHGVGQKSWDEVPDPQLRDDFDAIVGVDGSAGRRRGTGALKVVCKKP
jgi:hypothetical protein